MAQSDHFYETENKSAAKNNQLTPSKTFPDKRRRVYFCVDALKLVANLSQVSFKNRPHAVPVRSTWEQQGVLTSKCEAVVSRYRWLMQEINGRLFEYQQVRCSQQ